MILRLDDPAAMDIEQSGGKGRALAAMTGRGRPVPSGFVVTTKAFAAFCRLHAIDTDIALITSSAGTHDAATRQQVAELQARIRALPLPDDLAAALTAALAEADSDAVWAVRSSAVAEDSQAASFAGQFDTVLGVTGAAAIGTAIRHCWASLFHPEALLYKRGRGIGDERMAVVVQQLVEATASGVCFSLNPVSGARDEVVINANVGLGESVVGGAATPDTFIAAKQDGRILTQTLGSKLVKTVRVTGGSSEIPTTPEERAQPSLSPVQVAQLVALVRDVEAEEGDAVDVEWAFAGDDLYLLQSRPVTAVAAAADVAAGPPAGWIPSTNTAVDPRYPLHTNGNIGEILPGCITPLTWSRVGVLIDYAFTKQYRQLGVIDNEPDPETKLASLAFFYYRPYICISYFTEAARATPGLTPDIYLEEFIGRPATPTPPFTVGDLHPRQIKRFLRLIGGFLYHLATVGRGVARARRSIHAFLDELADARLPEQKSGALLDRLAFNPETGHLSLAHIWVSTFASAGFAAIRGRTQAWLGDDSGTAAAALVTGIGILPSAEPAFGIHALAQRVAGDDTLHRLFADPDDARTLSALRSSTAAAAIAFGKALDAFLSVHGHRGICEAELRTECWRDDPTQVIAMIRNYLLPNVTPPAIIRARQDEARKTATHEALAQLGRLRRVLLAGLLKLTRHFIHLREDLKNLITLREDRARRVYRLVATRLVAEGRLGSADDVYFLTAREVRALAAGTLRPADAGRTAAERRQEFEWCRQLVMPKLIDGKAEPIALETLSADRSLHGIGVYPGRIEGRARVILDPRLDAAIAPGEILVAPVTDAGWTPLFINAAGLVVEVGGLLSHGSVVAREYGLPAVVGVESATRRIRTGDRIAVDGAVGRVFILESTARGDAD